MAVKHLIMLEVEEGLLQAVLDIVDHPSEAYPESATAQDFFEVHWDLFETLAAKARELGMFVDCGGCGDCPACEQEEEYSGDEDEEEDEDECPNCMDDACTGCAVDCCDGCGCAPEDCTCSDEPAADTDGFSSI